MPLAGYFDPLLAPTYKEGDNTYGCRKGAQNLGLLLTQWVMGTVSNTL